MNESGVGVERLHENLAHLDVIEAAADGVDSNGESHRMARAGALLFLALMMVYVIMVAHESIKPEPSPSTVLEYFMILMVAGIFCMCGVGFSKTWVEYLDDQLMSYEPVNEMEYSKLQQRVIAARKIEVGCVKHWVACERESVERLIAIPTGPGTKFMNKSL